MGQYIAVISIKYCNGKNKLHYISITENLYEPALKRANEYVAEYNKRHAAGAALIALYARCPI